MAIHTHDSHTTRKTCFVRRRRTLPLLVALSGSSRALVSRCRGDVEVVSRLMSSSVSRLSSLMGRVRMSRCVEVCRGLCRGVSRACRGAECQGVEGVCLEAKHTAAQQYCLYTIQLLHIQFPTELPHWVCLFIPSTTVFLLLGCSLWCCLLKLGGSRPAVAGPRGRRPSVHKAVDGPKPKKEVSSHFPAGTAMLRGSRCSSGSNF